MILIVSYGCLSALYGADEPENILLDGGLEEIKKVEDVIAGTNELGRISSHVYSKGVD